MAAALTLDHGWSGRPHNLEPPLGLIDDCHDGVINPVAATHAAPSISDTNLDQLPVAVASAVPVITDAVDASSDAAKGAAPSYERKNSTAPNTSSSGKTTRVKKESGNKLKKGSLAELRLQRQEREHAAQKPCSGGQCRDANGKLVEPQPSRNERQSANPRREKPSSPDKPKSKNTSSRRATPSFFKKDEGKTEWDEWLEKQKGKTSSASSSRPIPSFFHDKKA